MVFQNYALYPHMNVGQNMGFALRLREGPEGRDRTASSGPPRRSSTSRTTSTASRGQLSGGQRQRVAMGRAIVREPRVFLMDEPLSNLDAKLRVATRAEIAALQQRLGITTVYVTHDQVEAMTMGDRVAVMKDGVLQQCDTPRALYDRPGERVRRRLHRLTADEPARGARNTRRDRGWRHCPAKACRIGLPAGSRRNRGCDRGDTPRR